MDEISDDFKTWPDQIINLRVSSTDCWKKSLFDFVINNAFGFDRIFLKVADKVDMDGISGEFETWPDWIICLSLMSPWLLKKPVFDFIFSINHSVLIGSSWNLQIRWTWMKPWINLKTVQVKLFILELHLLDCWKRLFSTLSSSQHLQFWSDFPEPYIQDGVETYWTVRPWGDTAHSILRLKYTKFWYSYGYVKNYVLQINECCRHWVTLLFSTGER